MSTVKERPILFSGAMVRAILDGRKTQTRRVLKQATGPSLSVDCEDGVAELSWLHGPGPGYDVEETIKLVACPYGKPGDRLWVRETWKPRISHSCAMDACDCADVWIDYAASAEGKFFADREIPDEWFMPQAAVKGRFVPSLHMPRWASRILLEVTGVRVERLNDCSEADAIAEGISPELDGWTDYSNPSCQMCMNPVDSYRTLWDSINGAGAWEQNPWVWVVEFRRAA